MQGPPKLRSTSSRRLRRGPSKQGPCAAVEGPCPALASSRGSPSAAWTQRRLRPHRETVSQSHCQVEAHTWDRELGAQVCSSEWPVAAGTGCPGGPGLRGPQPAPPASPAGAGAARGGPQQQHHCQVRPGSGPSGTERPEAGRRAHTPWTSREPAPAGQFGGPGRLRLSRDLGREEPAGGRGSMGFTGS